MGKRIILMYLILCLYLSYSLNRKKNKASPYSNHKMSKKKKIILALLISVPILALVFVALFVTAARDGGIDLFKSIYYYLCGCIPNMEINLSKFNYDYYTYGLTFISGLIRPFITLFSRSTNVPLSDIFKASDAFLFDASSTNIIAPGVSYNAFVTMFYFFYRDFGFFGVIFESFILGLALSFLYKKIIFNGGKKDYRLLAIYLVTMIGLSMSFVRWQIVSVGFAITYYYAFFVFKKSKLKIRRTSSNGIDSNKKEFSL